MQHNKHARSASVRRPDFNFQNDTDWTYVKPKSRPHVARADSSEEGSRPPQKKDSFIGSPNTRPQNSSQLRAIPVQQKRRPNNASQAWKHPPPPHWKTLRTEQEWLHEVNCLPDPDEQSRLLFQEYPPKAAELFRNSDS